MGKTVIEINQHFFSKLRIQLTEITIPEPQA